MIFNDHDNYKLFQLWLHAYQTKTRNPGNTVAARNSVLDYKMTSYYLQIENVITMAFIYIK